MEDILYFDIHMPFWTSFKVGGTVNYQPTYSIPPFTTLYGLIANALGLEQDDYSLRDYLKFSLKTLYEGELVEDYTNVAKPEPSGKDVIRLDKMREDRGYRLLFDKSRRWMTGDEILEIGKSADKLDENIKKAVGMGWISREEVYGLVKQLEDSGRRSLYTTHIKPMAKTQVIRQRIIKPSYRVYLKIKKIKVELDGNKKDLGTWIKKSLQNPKRPLYLGQSDDMIVIEQISDLKDIGEVDRKFVNEIDSIIPMAIEKHEIILLPISFEYKESKYQKKHGTFTHKYGGIKLEENIEVFIIEGEHVVFEDFQPYKS